MDRLTNPRWLHLGVSLGDALLVHPLPAGMEVGLPQACKTVWQETRQIYIGLGRPFGNGFGDELSSNRAEMNSLGGVPRG